MDLPKISVITCSYNQGNYLEETILSVLNQSYPNVEYIVIDGSSTDNSVDIIKKYDRKITYWVSEPDNGQTDALMKGFNKATGDILCWLCSDDLLEPHALEEVANFFTQRPDASVVYGDTMCVDVEGKVIKKRKDIPFNRFIILYTHNFVPQPSTFWRAELFKRVGGFNPDFDLAMDLDLWLRFSEVTQIHHVKKKWSRMRIYPEQKTQRLLSRKNEEKTTLRERYFGPEQHLTFIWKKILAKGLRISQKISYGCYW